MDDFKDAGQVTRINPTGPIIALSTLLAGGGIIAFFFMSGRSATVTPTPVETAAPTETPAPPAPADLGKDAANGAEKITLPPLDQSDDAVRKLVEGISSRPEIARWLMTDALIRRFVAVVDNVADGLSPRTHVSHIGPQIPYAPEQRQGVFYANPTDYARYDNVADVFCALDPKGTAALYHQCKPLIDEAYKELGYPDKSFDVTLTRAIHHLLETPVVEGDVELVPRLASFKYYDPKLEGLSLAQKHLLRMGPDNVRRIEAQLRRIAGQLGIPPSDLP
ncbi:MAG: DUF3014 domain-containing protein [Acidobacteriota bacterium]